MRECANSPQIWMDAQPRPHDHRDVPHQEPARSTGGTENDSSPGISSTTTSRATTEAGSGPHRPGTDAAPYFRIFNPQRQADAVRSRSCVYCESMESRFQSDDHSTHRQSGRDAASGHRGLQARARTEPPPESSSSMASRRSFSLEGPPTCPDDLTACFTPALPSWRVRARGLERPRRPLPSASPPVHGETSFRNSLSTSSRSSTLT